MTSTPPGVTDPADAMRNAVGPLRIITLAEARRLSGRPLPWECAGTPKEKPQ